MRRFLKRLLLFAAIPLVIAVAWTAFVVVMEYRSYVGALTLAEGETMVVCGDSQTKDALDPAIIPGLRNFSTAATTCDQDAMRLKDVLAANPGKVRRVLIDVSPLKIGYDISRPVSELNAARVHALAWHGDDYWKDRKSVKTTPSSSVTRTSVRCSPSRPDTS